MEEALQFKCKMHRKMSVLQAGNKDSCKEYLVAFNTNTVSSLKRAKLKFSEKTAEYLSQTIDEEQYPAAAVAEGFQLHGIFTEQGAESMNAASVKFRRGDAALSVLQGMVELRAKQHLERNAKVNALDEYADTVPPAIRKRLDKSMQSARMSHKSVMKIGDSGLWSVQCPHVAGKIYTVNTNAKTFENRCCQRSTRDRNLCAHQCAVCIAAGVDPGTLVHSSDTTADWRAQYSPDAPEFVLPTGAPEGSERAMIKLRADDDAAIEISNPVLTARPRGAPTTVRKEALVFPKTLRMCGKCKKMVSDHDARTCQGFAELPDSLSQSNIPAASRGRPRPRPNIDHHIASQDVPSEPPAQPPPAPPPAPLPTAAPTATRQPSKRKRGKPQTFSDEVIMSSHEAGRVAKVSRGTIASDAKTRKPAASSQPRPRKSRMTTTIYTQKN
jgi:hypothetical protein